MTKKVVNFFEKKSHPAVKILAAPMLRLSASMLPQCKILASCLLTDYKLLLCLIKSK